MQKDLLSLPRKVLGVVLERLKPYAGMPRDMSDRFASLAGGKIKSSFGGGRLNLLLWAAVTYALVLIAMVLLIKIAFSGKDLTEQAMKNGQSVVIHLATGDITGKAAANSVGHNGPGKASINQVPGGDGLAPAPLASLTEQTEKGILPVVGRDGTMPWKYYARPYTQQENASKDRRPLVAIVFTNLGLSRPLTEDVLQLPHEFTLGFSPYAGDTAKWAAKGRQEGFESVIDLPIQTEEYPLSDPGSYGLLEDLSPDENIGRIHGVLAQFPGFIGVLASPGEKMTANKDEIKPYLVELKSRGLLFLYVKTPKNAALDEFIKANFYYALGIDKVIDTEITRSAIEAQLQSLVTIAKTQGYAIGLAHSYPPTTEELALWAPTLYDQGVDLVPVSAIESRLQP